MYEEQVKTSIKGIVSQPESIEQTIAIGTMTNLNMILNLAKALKVEFDKNGR